MCLCNLPLDGHSSPLFSGLKLAVKFEHQSLRLRGISSLPFRIPRDTLAFSAPYLEIALSLKSEGQTPSHLLFPSFPALPHSLIVHAVSFAIAALPSKTCKSIITWTEARFLLLTGWLGLQRNGLRAYTGRRLARSKDLEQRAWCRWSSVIRSCHWRLRCNLQTLIHAMNLVPYTPTR